MKTLVRSVRVMAIGSTALVSLSAAALMLWVLVRPEVLGSVRTGALLAVLGLTALPIVTAIAWIADRRVCQRETRAASTPTLTAARLVAARAASPVTDRASERTRTRRMPIPTATRTRERTHRRRTARAARVSR